MLLVTWQSFRHIHISMQYLNITYIYTYNRLVTVSTNILLIARRFQHQNDSLNCKTRKTAAYKTAAPHDSTTHAVAAFDDHRAAQDTWRGSTRGPRGTRPSPGKTGTLRKADKGTERYVAREDGYLNSFSTERRIRHVKNSDCRNVHSGNNS